MTDDERPREATPDIRLVDVTKRYAAATALEGVTIDIRPGEFHGLVGPNGSGKTTLFRVLAGLTRPTEGRVERRGDPTVGFSFQEPRFYPELTVRENVSVFRRLSGASVDDDWVETLYEELRLEPAVHRRADELSGGFRTKLDLALALLARPQYVLLDEPLADVDEHSRRRIRAFLERYQRAEPDRTVVVSTHNVRAFARSFDRLTVLVDGTVRADEPVRGIDGIGSPAASVGGTEAVEGGNGAEAVEGGEGAEAVERDEGSEAVEGGDGAEAVEMGDEMDAVEAGDGTPAAAVLERYRRALERSDD
ncbi:ABC transporter ATP-binding protein [Halovivax sp.]|uniref:ABC transporter ATP-binding protein n=1 Tax=Halovivax sp. TaxID=1935978 RepID=UPI0025C273EE|nr:ABC transporter ATP-binding protein [Halovivax sp.]